MAFCFCLVSARKKQEKERIFLGQPFACGGIM
jgi:hypothetical protein